MSNVLGIDTSNYTTSVSILSTDSMTVSQKKMLLPVKSGQKGVRQSDAVFYHTNQLPLVLDELLSNESQRIDLIGVSNVPRNIRGSYMPCFLVGNSFAESYSSITKVTVHKTAHQVGHILSALYSSDKLSLLKSGKSFIAFHLSGGTTDCLLCTYDENSNYLLDIKTIGTSLDLKAGQAVDRIGIMLSLDFPCGKELEKLASKSNRIFRIKPCLKGTDICLSGVENKAMKMLEVNESKEDIAKFCLDFILLSLKEMTKAVIKEYGDMPLVYAGGVMSNKYIKDDIKRDFNAYFAEPEFSCDNSVGCAIYAALKEGLI